MGATSRTRRCSRSWRATTASPRSGPGPEDALTVASWRLAWERSPLRGVPLLIRDDGETVYGLKDLETLARFVQAG